MDGSALDADGNPLVSFQIGAEQGESDSQCEFAECGDESVGLQVGVEQQMVFPSQIATNRPGCDDRQGT